VKRHAISLVMGLAFLALFPAKAESACDPKEAATVFIMGLSKTKAIRGLGTGVFVDQGGLLLTALHVVDEVDTLRLFPSECLTPQEKQRISNPSDVVLIRQDRDKDLALYRVSASDGQPFPAVSVGAWPAGRQPVTIVRPTAITGRAVIPDVWIVDYKNTAAYIFIQGIICKAAQGEGNCGGRVYAPVKDYEYIIIAAIAVKGYSGSPVFVGNSLIGLTAAIVAGQQTLVVPAPGFLLTPEEPLPVKPPAPVRVSREAKEMLSSQTMPGAALTMLVQSGAFDTCSDALVLVEEMRAYHDLSSSIAAHNAEKVGSSFRIISEEEIAAVARLEKKLADQAKRLAPIKCLANKALVSAAIEMLIGASKLARHYGSALTLWIAIRESLVRPILNNARWRRMGPAVMLGPLEFAIMTRLFVRPTTGTIEDTNACDMLKILEDLDLLTQQVSCAEAEVHWKEMLNGIDTKKRWLELATEPEVQAMFWERVLASRIVSPLKVLSWSSGIPQNLLTQRVGLIEDSESLIKALEKARKRLVTAGRMDAKVQELSGQAFTLRALNDDLPDSVRSAYRAPPLQEADVNAILAAFAPSEIIVRRIASADDIDFETLLTTLTSTSLKLASGSISAVEEAVRVEAATSTEQGQDSP
jgi:hypothetical protein